MTDILTGDVPFVILVIGVQIGYWIGYATRCFSEGAP